MRWRASTGGNRQGHADGMAAPQHQAGRGLSHSGNQLRDAQTGLDVPAYGVQQKQDSVDLLILLQAGQQGHDMLVFGAFRRLAVRQKTSAICRFVQYLFFKHTPNLSRFLKRMIFLFLQRLTRESEGSAMEEDTKTTAPEGENDHQNASSQPGRRPRQE